MTNISTAFFANDLLSSGGEIEGEIEIQPDSKSLLRVFGLCFSFLSSGLFFCSLPKGAGPENAAAFYFHDHYLERVE